MNTSESAIQSIFLSHTQIFKERFWKRSELNIQSEYLALRFYKRMNQAIRVGAHETADVVD